MRTPRPVIGALLIAGAVALAWSGTFTAPFELDDHSSIIDNASIRELRSLAWMRPPATAGETVSGRPVLNFSFALNHALGGLDVRGYHVVNTVIHALAALTLFGLVRRVTARAHSRAHGGATAEATAPEPGATPEFLLAFAVALLWAVHPLHTGAVTYIVQRAESLCGLLYLLTLHCFVRGVECGAAQMHAPLLAAKKKGASQSSGPSRRPLLWYACAFASCVLAVGTKEVAATAPLVALLLDRAFLSGSFREALRARRRVHAALASTWLVLAALIVANRGRGGSAGLGAEVGPWDYFLTQAGAIVHYLRLAIWPAGLVFDHGTPVAPAMADVLPQLLLLTAIALGVLWLLRRNRAAGFLGAAFFLILAPSSSFVPVATQTIAEHRMYLPLAALIALAALGVRRVARDLPARGAWLAPVAAVAVLSLGTATFVRNRAYRSELALWQDTVAKRPENPRAHNNLGIALAVAGRTDEAIAQFESAVALQPNHAFAHFNLAVLLADKERWDAAIAHYRAAIAADAGYLAARVNLGDLLARLGRSDEAIAEQQAALAIDPDAPDARTNLAALFIKEGRTAEAVAILRSVIADAPALAEAHYHLGRALEKSGVRGGEVDAAYREAVRLKPDLAAAQLALGNRLAPRGDLAGAERCFREAIRIDPRMAEAHFALGNLLASREQFDAAMASYREALSILPDHAEALNNLGNCQLVTGRFREAAATYEQVLRLRPGDPTATANLGVAREMARQGSGGGR